MLYFVRSFLDYLFLQQFILCAIFLLFISTLAIYFCILNQNDYLIKDAKKHCKKLGYTNGAP